MNFIDLIYDACKTNRSGDLIHWPDSGGFPITTSKALLRDINYRRHIFRSAGFKPGLRIVLMQSISPDILGTMLALMAEGCAVVVPPSGAGWRVFSDLRRKAGADRVVLLPGASKLLRVALWVLRIPILRFPNIKKNELEFSDTNPVSVFADDLALISFSSGSTGKSKPVFRTHGVLKAQHEAIEQEFPSFEGQVDLPLFPNVLLHHLANGTTCAIPDIPGWKLNQFEPERIFSQLVAKKINTLTGNVYYFKALTKAARGRGFKEVKACGIGGSPVPENLLSTVQDLFPNATIHVIYGATEAEPIAVRSYSGSPSPWKGYHVGKPVGGIELKFQNTFPIRPGSDGEIMVGEINVRGAHVVSGNKNWHPTGDYGYLEDGELYLTARKGNEAEIEGWQHYHIEHGLSLVTGVRQVAAIAESGVFNIYFAGTCSIGELHSNLPKTLPSRIVGKIIKRKSLPVDRRHFSKILYKKI